MITYISMDVRNAHVFTQKKMLQAGVTVLPFLIYTQLLPIIIPAVRLTFRCTHILYIETLQLFQALPVDSMQDAL